MEIIGERGPAALSWAVLGGKLGQGAAASCRKPRSGACGAFRAAWDGLERSLEGLGLSRGRIGALLGEVPGSLGAVSGRSWGILGRSWSDLRRHSKTTRFLHRFLIDLGGLWGAISGAFP